MPVPQKNSLFVEQASCLFIKSLLRMVQHLSNNLLTIARSPKKPLSLTITTLRTLSGSRIGAYSRFLRNFASSNEKYRKKPSFISQCACVTTLKELSPGFQKNKGFTLPPTLCASYVSPKSYYSASPIRVNAPQSLGSGCFFIVISIACRKAWALLGFCCNWR